MDRLTHTERELVALGAALGSNCVPCIEYHIPEARKAGLTDGQISEAVHLADKVRKVPARKVLDAALGMLSEGGVGARAEQTCGGQAGGTERTEPVPEGGTEQPCCS